MNDYDLKKQVQNAAARMDLFDNTPYLSVINKIVQVHDRKKFDYANDDEFSNFKESARYAGVTVDQAFDVLIGTKIARLRNLKESGKVPNNESIADTELDLANYIIIKMAWQEHVRDELLKRGLG